jgi:hypothetical protein
MTPMLGGLTPEIAVDQRLAGSSGCAPRHTDVWLILEQIIEQLRFWIAK